MTDRIVVAVIVLLLQGALGLYAVEYGRTLEARACGDSRVEAERKARETERDLQKEVEASRKQLAEKERLLDEQTRQTATWRAALARVRHQRIPAIVGVQLDAVSGASAAATLAGAPRSDPDAAALSALIGTAETLDIVRENYARCRTNIGRLTEAKQLYEQFRHRPEEAQ